MPNLPLAILHYTVDSVYTTREVYLWTIDMRNIYFFDLDGQMSSRTKKDTLITLKLD